MPIYKQIRESAQLGADERMKLPKIAHFKYKKIIIINGILLNDMV